jgi:hypothetical protein
VKRPPHLHRQGQGSVQRDAAPAGPSSERARDQLRDEIRDELAADELRRRLRVRGILPIEPDDRIRELLAQGECVVAVRRAVAFERRASARDGDSVLGVDLYVTTHRLVILGPVRLEYPLAEIREMYVAAGAVRLVDDRNRALEFGVADPRVLRVEIAAVREAIRVFTARKASRPQVDDQDSVR